MNSVRYSRSLRTALLTSAAGLCIAMVPVAHADEINDPTQDPVIERPVWQEVVRESQGSGSRPVWEDTQRISQFERQDVAVPEPQIVIANPPAGPGQTPNTTITARDTVPVTGVGQMVVDAGGGFVGLCTASLINPRTVIFAAHCVNDQAGSTYGYANGGTGISFGFNNNNLPSVQAWLKAIGGSGNTNTGTFLYNSHWVSWNPLSNAPNSGGSGPNGEGGFLQADIAVAALDTPAKNVPQWAMLFSALPARPINAADGAGYTVGLAGYGNNGTASTGSTGGIDFRRRIAENIIGGLASLDQFENFLFGGAASDNPQNLYWIDFDDPRRGTANPPSPFDFNAWRDNATPGRNGGLSQEGITASGDSGGPLILTRIGGNTVAKQLILGVLSGGYTRFFSGQPANSYGTASFYQPLYLYWDWVAANNPYHYVSSVAGNANWNDPTHWITNLDPNYYILDSNGNAINGLPTDVGAGATGNTGTWGQACFQSGGVSDCLDMSTGVETIEVKPIGTDGAEAPGGAANGRAIVGIEGLGGFTVEREAQATGNGNSASNGGGIGTNALPAATIDNGLPGATNFVPNNLTGGGTVKPRYFDVTLSATGTTTLDTAVTIDRFGIAGAGAALNITSTGSLTSLMDINQITGTMSVNGALTSPGDYFMMAGGLNGTGTITTPFFTSVAGTISPGSVGTAGTVGSLTFRGNIILSSGNTYMLDIGASGTSDRIVVNRNGAGTGLANLGGRLVLNSISASATLRAGNSYTILTSEGGISGTFQTPTAFSAILTPRLTYTTNAVTMTVQAGLYGNIVPQSDEVGFAYALLLDRNRPQAASRDALFGPLDLQNAATIRTNLEGLRPATETLIQSLGMVGVNNQQGFVQERLTLLDPGSTGGTFARYGSPNQVAMVGLAGRSVAGLSGMGYDNDVRAASAASSVQEDVLPEGTSGFVAGGYLNGDSAPANGVAGRDDYDGWYVGGGIETWDDQSGIGFAASYTRLDGTGAFPGTTARANLYQGSLYGKIEMRNGVTLDAAVTAGLLQGDTRRAVTFVGTPYVLTSSTGNLVVVSEVGLGGDIEMGNFKLTPRIAGRATHIGFSRSIEEGGPMALEIDREPINSIQGRAGLTLSGTGKVRPFLSGYYVHEFQDRPGVIGANFAGGLGGNVLFDLNNIDADYGEVAGGLSFSAGSVDFSVSAETTIDRTDVSGQAYRGSISFRF